MSAKEWIEYLRHAEVLKSFQTTVPSWKVAPVIFRKVACSPHTSNTLTGKTKIPAIPARNSYNCFDQEKYFCCGYPAQEQEIYFFKRDINRLLAGIAGKIQSNHRYRLVVVMLIHKGASGFGYN